TKAVKFYKQGLNEYNRGNYVTALKNVERSLSFYRYSKNKKLMLKLRQLGYDNYTNGISLINFKPDLALKYLLTAEELIDPKDKKTKEKISEAIEQLRSQLEEEQHTGE
ncbi:MAG: hypothetical protein V1647_00300, partial [Pseudomonadota bacterium]